MSSRPVSRCWREKKGRVGGTGVKRVVLLVELSFFDLLSIKFTHTL